MNSKEWIAMVSTVALIVILGAIIWTQGVTVKTEQQAPVIPEAKTPQAPLPTGMEKTKPGRLLLIRPTDQSYVRFDVLAYDGDGEPQKLTMVETSLPSNVKYANGKVYFLNSQWQIETVDLSSQERQTISVPETGTRLQGPERNAIADFVVSSDRVYFIAGHCGEQLPCRLGVYNLNTGIVETIHPNIQEDLSSTIFNFIRLQQYDEATDSLLIRDSGGDAAFVSATLYRIDAQSGKVEMVKTLNNHPCEYTGETCSREENRENAEIYTLLYNGPITACDGMSVFYEPDFVVVMSDSVPESFFQHSAIGCWK